MSKQRDLGKKSVQLQLTIEVAERASAMARIINGTSLSRVIEPMVVEWCAKHADHPDWQEHLRRIQEPVVGRMG
jgi:hypothetical protein